MRTADEIAYFLKWTDLGVFADEQAPPEWWTRASSQEYVIECMMLLEDYTQSFVRDAPTYTRLAMRLIQAEQPEQFAPTETQRRLAALRFLLEKDVCMSTRTDFLSHVEPIVKGLDEHYLRIRAARKALFSSDDTSNPDMECHIDLELWRMDEPIRFDIERPFIGPLTAYDATRHSRWH